jgi:hypothetical protein
MKRRKPSVVIPGFLASEFKRKPRTSARRGLGTRAASNQPLAASALNFGVRYSAELSNDASCM